jgi:hypothetical protein
LSEDLAASCEMIALYSSIWAWLDVLAEQLRERVFLFFLFLANLQSTLQIEQ